ncbi:MAG: hypothetical protein K8F24_05780 [Bacteroidales bacterium]|nr:hypothetical protein [Bacteroidales bacterium]
MFTRHPQTVYMLPHSQFSANIVQLFGKAKFDDVPFREVFTSWNYHAAFAAYEIASTTPTNLLTYFGNLASNPIPVPRSIYFVELSCSIRCLRNRQTTPTILLTVFGTLGSKSVLSAYFGMVRRAHHECSVTTARSPWISYQTDYIS